MGVTNVTLNSLKEAIPKKLENLNIINLGDQIFYLKEGFKYDGIEMKFLKEFFVHCGANVQEIDIHGKNNVLKLDFRESMPEELIGKADILTNFGFTEHVTNQYMAWKNIHELLKVGGICISELPGMENFPGHLDCPYYTEDFFRNLKDVMNYEILELRYQEHEIPIKGQVCWCVFKKITDEEFISEKLFKELIESKLGTNI